MNPLAAYLLTVLKNEKTCETKAFVEAADALSELGYWLLERPKGCPRDKLPKCKIEEECRWVEEFETYTPPCKFMEGFATMVDVYEDVEVAEGDSN